MYTYEITLTRWCSKAGERRNKTDNVHCENFAEAVNIANIMVRVANDVDPDREYKVAKIEQNGLRGTHCSHGWLTMDEYIAQESET